MVSIDLKLSLPDDVASEARARGLLDPAALEGMLREELRRRRVDALFAAADRLAGTAGPAMTEAEVEAEVQAVRATRRNGHAPGA
jgi:hypothetical protein